MSCQMSFMPRKQGESLTHIMDKISKSGSWVLYVEVKVMFDGGQGMRHSNYHTDSVRQFYSFYSAKPRRWVSLA
jgi:hypothetical protein